MDFLLNFFSNKPPFHGYLNDEQEEAAFNSVAEVAVWARPKLYAGRIARIIFRNEPLSLQDDTRKTFLLNLLQWRFGYLSEDLEKIRWNGCRTEINANMLRTFDAEGKTIPPPTVPAMNVDGVKELLEKNTYLQLDPRTFAVALAQLLLVKKIPFDKQPSHERQYFTDIFNETYAFPNKVIHDKKWAEVRDAIKKDLFGRGKKTATRTACPATPPNSPTTSKSDNL